MEWSKIKNIILLILVGLNLILLVMVGQRQWESKRYREEARTGALEVLRQEGIAMERSALPEESDLWPMRAERDRTEEAALAEALLTGAVKTGDRGRDTYEGEKGEAWFRLDGSFGFDFEPGAYPLGDQETAAEHGAKLLTDAGYACEVLGVEERENAVHITLRQTWEGAPLFSCGAVLVYENGSLSAIESGMRLVGTPVVTARTERLNVAAVLLHFLSGVREGGWLPSVLYSMTVGYEVTPETSGGASLEPVWEIVSDAGVFYVDGIRGSLSYKG